MRSKGHEAIGAWVVLLLLVVGFPKSLKECKETLVASKDVVDSYIQLVISYNLRCIKHSIMEVLKNGLDPPRLSPCNSYWCKNKVKKLFISFVINYHFTCSVALSLLFDSTHCSLLKKTLECTILRIQTRWRIVNVHRVSSMKEEHD